MPQKLTAPKHLPPALAQLAQFKQWVAWRYELRDGKRTKVPSNPRTGHRARSDDPQTWGSYDQALARHQCDGFDGLGFMLWPAAVELVGIDIDNCLDEAGHLSPLAARIVALLDSYTEISPSGQGLRIFVWGTLPEGRRKHTGLGVELYVAKRFLTVTGNHLPGTPAQIYPRSEQAAALHRELFPPQPQPAARPLSQLHRLDDQALLARIRHSKQGAKFEALWRGETTGYPSQSEADFALAGILYFWSQGDRVQVKRLFALSGLYREKWDRLADQILDGLAGSQVRDPGQNSGGPTESRPPHACPTPETARFAPPPSSPETQARRDQIEAVQMARALELAHRWQADFAIPFLAEERVDSQEVRETRALFSDARKWQVYCEHRWPDLDSEKQRQIKLAENREARPESCGEEHWRTLPTGEVKKATWHCGLCDPCRSRQAGLLRRALDEIRGIALPTPGTAQDSGALIRALVERARQELGGHSSGVRNEFRTPSGSGGRNEFRPPTPKPIEPLDETEPEATYLKPIFLQLLEQARHLGPKEAPDPTQTPEPQPRTRRRGEAAPPLPRVEGPLNLLTVETEEERVKFIRKLRRQGVRYRCFPIEREDGSIAFEFIVNSAAWGDPIGVLLTNQRLKRWAVGVSGKRASGDLLPCLKALEARYREPLPYEVVCPELDDGGRPVDQDIFYLDLPSLGTTAPLPEVAVDFAVTSPESLQAALLAIHKEQLEILVQRKVVIYGVNSSKRFYTRYTTLPDLLREFNERNEAIKAARNVTSEP